MPNRDHPNDAALDTIEEAVRRDDEFSVWQLGELRNRAAGLRKMLKAPELCLGTTAKATGRVWRAAIPSEYTGTPYPLQYYFEVKAAPASAALFPGLGPQRTNQPYFVVRRA